VLQGKHEDLISKEVFLKLHNLLHVGESLRRYSFEDENLPMKMFVRSSVCGTPYTGFTVRKNIRTDVRAARKTRVSKSSMKSF
tara:strand:- start:638 stop:886 length:249 start_codon:yes stop_codon:yes gene_type:complete